VIPALAKRAFHDARIRTFAFAYLFAVYAYIQPSGYRHAYPTFAERLEFTRGFATNIGLHLLYGDPREVQTVSGYTAWRVGGILAIASAAFGLFAVVRAMRAEEDSGRLEFVLSGVIGRRTLTISALLAIGAGTLLLWLAELAGFVAGGLAAGGSAYLALATISVVPVCVGIGALASQLAPSRRIALELGGTVVALLFVLRVVADTTEGTGWLRWLTPLGWAEEMHPFTGAQPAVMLLPLATSAALLLIATSLAARRDIGTGLLPARDEAAPRLALLSSPTFQALRDGSGALAAWSLCVAVFAFILGTVSKSISSADVSESVQKQIGKLGSAPIDTPAGHLAFIFIFVVLAVSIFVCAQVGAARREESEQQLETLLALPVGRARWLAGRLLLAVLMATAIALTAGFFSWAGAVSGGAHISLPTMLEAGANALPVAMLFLGVGALAYALIPRGSAGIAYGLVAIAFIWQLVGSLVEAPSWLLDLTPFAHVGLIPAQPFRADAAAVMLALGAAAATAAIAAFRRRDLIGA
jgi:ABC-2 type transport system permease protein